MPFKSRKQERYLQINEPEIYRDWVEKYGHFKGAEAFSADETWTLQGYLGMEDEEKDAILITESIGQGSFPHQYDYIFGPYQTYEEAASDIERLSSMGLSGIKVMKGGRSIEQQAVREGMEKMQRQDAESFEAECKHENWERGETIEPQYIYENGELVDEVNLYWVECNECGAIGDFEFEGLHPTRIKWDAESFSAEESDDPLKYLRITGYYPKLGRRRTYYVYTGDRWNPIDYGQVSMKGKSRGEWSFYWSDDDYGIEGSVRKNKSYYTMSPFYINGHFLGNEGPTFQSTTQWGCVLEAIKYAYDFKPRVEDQKKKWWQFWKAESFGAESNEDITIRQQAIDTIEARVADYTIHEDVSPYWGGGIANPNKYLYFKLRYAWEKHPEDREGIIQQYIRGIEDGRIDPSNPLPHGEPNQHLPSKWDAESFSAEFAAEASYCSNFNDHQWIPFGSEEMSCDKCDAIVTPETIKLASEDMFADLDGITRDEKGMRHSPHKKCPDCGAKPTSSWIDPGKCECGRVMNPSEYTNIRFSAELKRDSCCCGATKSKPCACMIQGVMECNATCPCSLEKSAESFGADSSETFVFNVADVSGESDDVFTYFIKADNEVEAEEKLHYEVSQDYPDMKFDFMLDGSFGAESFNSYKVAPDLSSYTKAELVSSIAGPQGTAAYQEVVYDPIAQSRMSAETATQRFKDYGNSLAGDSVCPACGSEDWDESFEDEGRGYCGCGHEFSVDSAAANPLLTFYELEALKEQGTLTSDQKEYLEWTITSTLRELDSSSYTKQHIQDELVAHGWTLNRWGNAEPPKESASTLVVNAEGIDSFSPTRLMVLGASIGVALGLYKTRGD